MSRDSKLNQERLRLTLWWIFGLWLRKSNFKEKPSNPIWFRTFEDQPKITSHQWSKHKKSDSHRVLMRKQSIPRKMPPNLPWKCFSKSKKNWLFFVRIWLNFFQNEFQGSVLHLQVFGCKPIYDVSIKFK